MRVPCGIPLLCLASHNQCSKWQSASSGSNSTPQSVDRGLAGSELLILARSCLVEADEAAHQIPIDGHDRTSIIVQASVVWRREERDQLPIGNIFVAIFHHFMAPHDQVEVKF